MTEFKIIAKTFQGLEEVLAKELINLGANNVEIGRRMVAFTGDKEMLYKANFCTRTAVKVLKPIKEFKAKDADEVYEEAKKIDWEKYMDVKSTFLVDSVIFSENFRHSKFVAYRVKDAIADYWREKSGGDRPNVVISNPDLRVNVHIAEDEVTISLDSSGESLHQRGYKTATVQAPLNEVLAAGLIMLTGWDGECDLIDPFCGSGTILIEAALIAQNVYPGVFRKEYAFEKWKDFDADLFDRIYNDDSQEREFDHKIYGYDINRQVVQIATDNVLNAGVKDIVSVEQRDFYEFEQPLDKAIMITNPPYGDRITTDDIFDLYETIGKNLKRNFVGNDAWIISHHEELFDKIGFRPSTKYALFNGSLECEFRKYQIFDGKLKERREEGLDIKTDEDRRHNLKFKPHKKNEDGEWTSSRSGRKVPTDDEEHYFKSKPFKERPSKDIPYEEEKDRKWGKDSRWKMFEAEDEEEAEIINRHLGKWGDRVARPSRGEKKPERRDSRDERERFTDRESRQEARKSFFAGKSPKEFGERKASFEGRRGERDERRPRRDGERPARKFDGQKGEGRPFRGKKK
ncbi:MAG: RNA methyltransferase [Bacteroidaceae bacterium]|jgi:putative N6-adenine-specific DNA methylase|nr:RNA methyltransferase [Bacteroidaceae bacterium]MBR6973258.1 RNA methyltransferase [Bacteroidaceae bacterium]MCR5044828.1 RNA methyltransferase [Bacteroidaceae bacterium]MDO4201755.1 THUMP domain-containing protein [Bacteroidales bacterium]